MALLLVLGRLLLVLVVKVAEGVGSLQRLGGGVEVGFNVWVGSTNEPGRRTRTGIINWPGMVLSLKVRLSVKLITV